MDPSFRESPKAIKSRLTRSVRDDEKEGEHYYYLITLSNRSIDIGLLLDSRRFVRMTVF